jgi:hypothetical protein
MALLAKAVVETRRVHAFAAPQAAAASGMNLDGDAVADLELIDGRTELDDRAHVLMPRA